MSVVRTLALGALAGCLIISPARALDVRGAARVVDGDTVEIGTEKIRLLGVDAPETDQLCLHADGSRWACGVEARDQLARHTAGKAWSCSGAAHDQAGRLLATCTVAGEDVNEWLVLQGWALSFVRYSHRYDRAEETAQASKAGIWSGAFYAPWEARHPDRYTVVRGGGSVPASAQKVLMTSVSAGEAPDPDCTIKANLGAKGGCIFHRPGMHSYAVLDMAKPGRRWFCTRDEAEAAGCREARN